MFCKYNDIFGLPNTGLHKYRIFNLAIVDILSTIFLAYIIVYFTHWKFLYVLLGCFIGGILAHRLFCVRTTIDKLLFT